MDTKHNDVFTGCACYVDSHDSSIRSCALHTAAPDLLAVMERGCICMEMLIKNNTPCQIDKDTLKEMQAAIAKAKGA